MSSTSSTAADSEELKPDISPPASASLPKNKSAGSKTSSPKRRKSEGAASGPDDRNGEWTAEKRMRLMVMVIDAGYKQLQLESVASEVG